MKLTKRFVALGVSLLMVAAMALTAVAASSSGDTPSKTKAGIPGGGMMLGLEAVSELTGLSVSDIRAERQAGKSLAEIAAAKGFSQDQLVSAILTAEQEKLDTLKTEGKITQDQYDKILTKLEERITAQITETKAHNPQDRGGIWRTPGQSLDVISELTGLTEAEIQALLKDGKTLAEIAATKNISQNELISALVEAAVTKLDTALSNGKITQEQYDKSIADLEKRITEQVTKTPSSHPNFKGLALGFFGKNSLNVVSELTGLTEAEIQALLKDGKTLAEVAATKNVSQDNLVSALVEDAGAQLDTLKTAGKIPQEQYDKLISDLSNRITKQVTSTRPTPPEGFDRGKGIRGHGSKASGADL